MTRTAKTYCNPLRAFWRDTDGGSAVMVAVGLSVVLGAAALAIDYARAVTAQQFLSSAADAAALAAVSRLPDQDAARRMALDYVRKNLPADQYGKALTADDIEFGTWDAETGEFVAADRNVDEDLEEREKDEDYGFGGGMLSFTKSSESDSTYSYTYSATPTAVRVTTRRAQSNGNPLDTMFAWVFGSDSVDVAASAVAGRGGPPCVLALDPTEAAAMRLSWLARIEAVGCSVQVNSTAQPALEVLSSASVLASDICVGGTARVATTMGADPEPKEHCPGMSDPMAGLEVPDYDGCDYTDTVINADATLQPGVYCGGLTVGAAFRQVNATMEPGLYVVKDGPFTLTGMTALTGTGVTIFLTGSDALLSIVPGTAMDLTAPTDGTYQGVLFFQDPAFGGTHRWMGFSSANLRGVIYLPSGKLVSESKSSMTPEGACLVLIADTLEFGGYSDMAIDITSAECKATLPGAYGRGIVLLQ